LLLEQKFLKSGSEKNPKLNRRDLYRYFVHKRPFSKSAREGLLEWPSDLDDGDIPHFKLCGAILDRALVDLCSGNTPQVNSVLNWDYDDFCDTVEGRRLDPVKVLGYFRHVYLNFIVDK
jgi:hypothetical protein